MDYGDKRKEREVINIESKYPILRGISALYKVLAGLVIAFSIISFIFGVKENNRPLFFYSLIGGLFFVITLLAAAEVIKVFLDIEENTRVTKLIKMAEYEEE